MKTKYCFNIAGNSYRSLLVLFLLFNSHFYKLISQPVLKSGVSFQSSLGHGDSEDWPQCMIQSSDCLHYYFAGFTQYHDAVNGCYGPPNEPQDQVRAPIIGKFNPVTGTLIWEREYHAQIGYGNFTQIYEAGGFIYALGAEQKTPCSFSSWASFIVKVNPLNGDLESGYPLYFDPDLDDNSNTTDCSQSRIFSSQALFSNGNYVGSINSGRLRKSNESFNRAMIAKFNADQTIDLNFGTKGYYLGPANSEARRVIEIVGVSGIAYVYIGDYTISGSDKDVIVEALDQSGAVVWSKYFSEESLVGIYSDDEQSDQTVCSNLSTLENKIERGWDIIQDENNLYLSCMFDVIDLTGNDKNTLCEEFADYDAYLNVDIALIDLDVSDGNVQYASNVAQFEASDFYPDLELKNGKLYLLGAKSTLENNEIITKTDVLTLSTTFEVLNEKQFVTLGNINCPFDLMFDCDDQIVITGNNEENEEDYFFYKLSNDCQSSQNFSINNNLDISSNIPWSANKTINATVRVKSGGILTINNSAIIEFGASWDLVDYNLLATNPGDAKIPRLIVESGGTLILDNCTLKGLEACSNNAMWDGVELQNGGLISLINDATIMDAKFGILADIGQYNLQGHLNPTESGGGGIIQANGAHFLNCRRGIHFANCNSNTSSIGSTEFACTAYLKDPGYKNYIENFLNPNGVVQQLGTSVFVSANAASGMQFSASSWLNSTFLPPELRGIGILSVNSKFTVNNACSMQGLNIGIRADATDPLKYIYVSGSNQFSGNRTGIQLRGGSLHKIIAENEFIAKYDPASPVQIQATPGIGIFNAASTQTLIEENSFSAGGVNINNTGTYGIVSENTGSASSLYKKNLFTNVQIGNQTQKNNGGLNLWCNEHTQNTKAWYINPLTPGEFPNQGFCILSNALTSENEFKDPTCQNALNHIHSSVDFDYWVKINETNPPDCNSTSVSVSSCSDPESGCEQSIFFTPSNVGEYFSDVTNMQEGTERELLVNELLRYYINQEEIDTVLLLLGNEPNENYMMSYALTLLSLGEINDAQDVVENLPSNSPETESFVDYFDILVYAKINALALSDLPEEKVNDLSVIAENRTLAAYAAQAILENYYNMEFLSVLETDSIIQYRSKPPAYKNSSLTKSNLLIMPNPVKELLNLDFSFIDSGPYYFKLLNLDGKAIYKTSKKESIGSFSIDLGLIPLGVYFIQVENLDKTIVTKRFIKN